jgi:hypothetical protein
MTTETSMSSDPPLKSADPAVEAELACLGSTGIAKLRLRYRELFRRDPPKAFGPDLLRRSIGQRLQEKAYGGLSRSTRRLLDQLVKAYLVKPSGRIVVPRRIKPGSVLVREWKGSTHRVMVLQDGFAWNGRTFSNLSEIAREISGTRWNGPKFFGLRPAPDKTGDGASKAVAPVTGVTRDAGSNGAGRQSRKRQDIPTNGSEVGRGATT